MLQQWIVARDVRGSEFGMIICGVWWSRHHARCIGVISVETPRVEVTPSEKREGEQERHSLASRHQPHGQDIEPDSRSSIGDLRMLH